MAASQAKAEMADSGHAGTPTAPRTTADRTTIVPMAAAATFARHATAAGMTGSARAAAGKTASVTLATGSTTAGRDQYQRRGPNGSEGQGRDTNGADQADAAQSDESASDPVG